MLSKVKKGDSVCKASAKAGFVLSKASFVFSKVKKGDLVCEAFTKAGSVFSKVGLEFWRSF